MGNGAGYVSYQEIAGAQMAQAAHYNKLKKTAEPVAEAPVVRQLTLLGGPVVESKGRRRKK